jgi:hypothetical protein
MVFAIEYAEIEGALIAQWFDEQGEGTYVLQMPEPSDAASLSGQPVTVSCHATDIRRERHGDVRFQYHRACRIEPDEEI